MKTIAAFGGGLAGALALTILHETVRQVDEEAPRMDLLGMRSIAKLMNQAGETPPDDATLHQWALAGDVVSNALYYSLVGVGKAKHVWWRGALLGLGAGIGGVVLPGPLGLGEGPSSRTTQTKVMTVAWYTFGGLVAAAATYWLHQKQKKG